MPLDIQFFAEGGGDGAGTDNGNGGGSGSEGDKGTGAGAGAEGEGSKGEEGKPLTFDTFLKIPENQAEFDRRVQQAIGTATTRLKGDYEVMLNDQLSEAEKLAKMTDEQKAEYQIKKQNAELAKREADITKRELKATAKVTLAGKKLPVELADVLLYTDAKTCNDSIDVVEKAFQKSVEDAVKERLKGGGALTKAPESTDKMSEQVANAIKGNY